MMKGRLCGSATRTKRWSRSDSSSRQADQHEANCNCGVDKSPFDVFPSQYYRPQNYKFEIFDAVRRMLLGITLGMFFGSPSPLRAVFGVVLSVMSSIVQREQMPYFDKATSYLHCAFACMYAKNHN